MKNTIQSELSSHVDQPLELGRPELGGLVSRIVGVDSRLGQHFCPKQVDHDRLHAALGCRADHTSRQIKITPVAGSQIRDTVNGTCFHGDLPVIRIEWGPGY